MSQEKILEAALGLAEQERIHLIERLLESLGAETDGVDEEAFAEEISRRSAELDEGTADLTPWSDLKNEKW